MEKSIEQGGLPKSDSVEELAKFWDTHDLTDFAGELEEVRSPVFIRKKGKTVTVSLKASDAQRLKNIASSRGLKEPNLIRQWIVERLDDVRATERPPVRVMQSARAAAKPRRVPAGRKKRSPRPVDRQGR